LGKSIVLPQERKGFPLAKEERQKFVGLYSIADVGMEIAIVDTAEGVAIKLNGAAPSSLLYLENKNDHPCFYWREGLTEICFQQNAAGVIKELVLDLYGETVTGDRR
jgi:hypothetical protein